MGDRVDKRLERGTDLSIRGRQRAIELALGIIAATNERANAAATVIDRYDRAFQIRHRRVFAVLRRMIVRF